MSVWFLRGVQRSAHATHQKSSECSAAHLISQIFLSVSRCQENHGIALDDCAQSQLLDTNTPGSWRNTVLCNLWYLWSYLRRHFEVRVLVWVIRLDAIYDAICGAIYDAIYGHAILCQPNVSRDGTRIALYCSVETGVDKFARGVTELLSLPGLKLAPILMQNLNANLLNLFVQSTGFFDSGAVLYWFTFMQLSFPLQDPCRLQTLHA